MEFCSLSSRIGAIRLSDIKTDGSRNLWSDTKYEFEQLQFEQQSAEFTFAFIEYQRLEKIER